jgi:hypothetical protein
VTQQLAGAERLLVSEQSLRHSLRERGFLASIDVGAIWCRCAGRWKPPRDRCATENLPFGGRSNLRLAARDLSKPTIDLIKLAATWARSQSNPTLVEM